jgi:hypothetical protein
MFTGGRIPSGSLRGADQFDEPGWGTMRRGSAFRFLLVALLPVASCVLASPARADGPGRCYPPPCAVGLTQNAAVAQGLSAGPVVVPGSTEAAAGRGSPVPDVTIGLIAVVGSLSVVGLRRRRNIGRRGKQEPEPSRLRPALVRKGRERGSERVAVG